MKESTKLKRTPKKDRVWDNDRGGYVALVSSNYKTMVAGHGRSKDKARTRAIALGYATPFVVSTRVIVGKKYRIADKYWDYLVRKREEYEEGLKVIYSIKMDFVDRYSDVKRKDTKRLFRKAILIFHKKP